MNANEVTVRQWDESEPPTLESVRDRMEKEGLRPYRWSNGPGDVYAAHTHSFHKVIYVVEGSITFGLPERGEQVALEKGDRLDLPPGVRHDAVVGSRGVVCLEGHR